MNRLGKEKPRCTGEYATVNCSHSCAASSSSLTRATAKSFILMTVSPLSSVSRYLSPTRKDPVRSLGSIMIGGPENSPVGIALPSSIAGFTPCLGLLPEFFRNVWRIEQLGVFVHLETPSPSHSNKPVDVRFLRCVEHSVDRREVRFLSAFTRVLREAAMASWPFASRKSSSLLLASAVSTRRRLAGVRSLVSRATAVTSCPRLRASSRMREPM